MTHEVGDYGLGSDLAHEARMRQELAGLVIQDMGASEDDMAAPEAVLTSEQSAAILAASQRVSEVVVGSRRHRGDIGPYGRGPSLGELRVRAKSERYIQRPEDTLDDTTDDTTALNTQAAGEQHKRLRFPVPQIPVHGFAGGVVHDMHRRDKTRNI